MSEPEESHVDSSCYTHVIMENGKTLAPTPHSDYYSLSKSKLSSIELRTNMLIN